MNPKNVLNQKGSVGGPWLVFLAVVLLAGLIGFLVGHYLNAPSKTTGPSPLPTAVPLAPKADPAQAANELLKTLNQKLADMDLLKLLDREVETKPATVEGRVVPTYYEVFRLPSRMTPHDIGEALREVAKPLGATMVYDQSLFEFQFTPDWNPVEMDFIPTAKPRVCLIIDDGGYQKGTALETLYKLKVPITVSIIPDTRFAKSLAEEFPAHGVEVMCHMPMEGHEQGVVGNDYKELLTKGMDSAEAKSKVEKALEGLPNCRGLNNHMGSVATSDPELMWDVCQVLKEKGLFIIDSKTTAESVVEQVAHKAGVAVTKRNVFLDNVETPEAIQKQLRQAVAYAKKHGLAVAIGHFKTTTLKTLEEAVHPLREKGIQFVYASEVVKEQ